MQYKFQMLLLDKVRHLDILKARAVMELFSFLMDIWLHVAANVNQSLEIICGFALQIQRALSWNCQNEGSTPAQVNVLIFCYFEMMTACVCYIITIHHGINSPGV